MGHHAKCYISCISLIYNTVNLFTIIILYASCCGETVRDKQCVCVFRKSTYS